MEHSYGDMGHSYGNSYMNKGLFSAFFAYFLWGLLPIYWKQIQAVGATEILGHRILWSLVFLIALLLLQQNWGQFRTAVTDRTALGLSIPAAILLSINWGVYIWSVNNNYIVEASLGYFINPLLNVLLGVLVLKETLRIGQWVAIGFAITGVLYMTIAYGRPPYIALALAFTFAFYGFIKRKITLDAITGLSLETAVLTVPTLLFLLFIASRGQSAFFSNEISGASRGFLLGAGVATSVPLLFFAYGAQRIRFSTLGILQYVAPTLQFLIGVLLYGEGFSGARVVGFVLIWVGLGIYSAETLIQNRTHTRDILTPDAK